MCFFPGENRIKQYKTKISEWGYFKNTRRADAIAILRERALREERGKKSLFLTHQRPADLQKVERHLKRYKVRVFRKQNFEGSGRVAMTELVSRTPPPIGESLRVPEPWIVLEKFLFALDGLVRGLFESGDWRFHDNERLIESSSDVEEEQRRLMGFLSGLDQGCAAAQIGNSRLAGDRWRSAFLEVEYLMKGSFHNIVSNVVSKLVDLADWGFHGLATMLLNHIACLCQEYARSNHPIAAVFIGFDKINIDSLGGLEERTWTMLHSIFDAYIGNQCYNTFVLRIDGAKRRLRRSKQENMDECLPPLAPLEKEFGPLNCRSLDIMRLRLETLTYRGQYQQVTDEAPLLA